MKKSFNLLLVLAILALTSQACSEQGSRLVKDFIKSKCKPNNLITQVHTIEGLDLSHHNIVTSWDSVSTSFIFLKATEGSDVVDSKFREYGKKARKKGIKVGAYHFLSTSSSARKQFDNFKSIVRKQDIDLIPVLDIEKQTPGNRISADSLKGLVLEWSKLCEEQYGKRPIIYTGMDFYRKYLDETVKGQLLWFGNVDCPITYISTVPWDIWQYTVKTTPGIKGMTDHNVLNEKHKIEDIEL